jgi:hypothetical protein
MGAKEPLERRATGEVRFTSRLAEVLSIVKLATPAHGRAGFHRQV